MEVDKRLLGELEEMGFPEALATEALCSSGNSSIEEAINWLVDHDNDTNVSEPPMPQSLVDISIEASKPFHISEQVKLKAQALRSQACRMKAEKEKKLEREREKERIRTGRELLEAKRMVEESERKWFLAQRKAKIEEERRARDKIRQKLQQDKLERRGILGLPRGVSVPVKPNTPLPLRTKNLQQVDPACLPAAVREHMRECLRSIKHRNKEKSSEAIRAFQTLLIYIRNIINNPDEEKLRKIRISNHVFQERVGKFEEGIKFLELCGFERAEEGKFLLLPRAKVDVGVLQSAASQIQNALMNPFFGLLSK